MKKNVISIVLIVCATMQATLQASSIIDGSLDNSFGTGGIVTTALSVGDDTANAILFQPDGKIVAVGRINLTGIANDDFALVRYHSDGSLDSSFGIAGKVTTDFGGGGTDTANAALLQPDGKIIAIGLASNDFGLARYNSDGSLDSSFGIAGKVTTDFGGGGTDTANAALLQPDGKIVAIGQAGLDFGLARYNSDGSLDSSFGTGGIVTTVFTVGTDTAFAAILQPDGKIVGVGKAGPDFALARYNSDGSLDSSFGTAGKVTINVGADDQANAAILQSDGKIITVGSTRLGSDDFALVRYNSDGSLDSSFGTGGIVTTDFAGGTDTAFAAILQPDGKIIAIGQASDGVSFDFGLARYNSDGSPDSSFGTGGKVTTDFNSGFDEARAAILQSDGKIIAAGRDGSNFVLARYLVPSLEISQLAKDFRSKYYLLLNPNYSH